jgi:hypothetical protein
MTLIPKNVLMGKSPENVVLNKARQDKTLATIVDSLASMTLQDIDALSYMKYIKDGLKKIKTNMVDAPASFTTYDMIEAFVSWSTVPDVLGHCYTYLGDTTFVPVGNGRTSLEIKYGDLFFCPFEGGIWIDTIFSEKIPSLAKKDDGVVAFMEYKKRVRDRMNESVNGSGVIFDSHSDKRGDTISIAPNINFTIQRF